jgi:tripartite-type tricarboxylate transporter receptor subunit TctC
MKDEKGEDGHPRKRTASITQKQEAKTMKTRMIYVSFLVVLSVVVAGGSFAADYPTKSITLINPMPPGGALDIQARAFASVADKMLGQPVVVINKPGATGMLGGTAGAQAAPDGYTLTVGSVNIPNALEWEIANGRKPPFTRHDFATIGTFTMSPTLLVVPADAPYKNLADFIADAKARPGQLAFSSGGLYGMSHLPAEIFAMAAGLKFRHVPSGGGGPALAAVVGKHVDFNVNYPANTLPLVRGNKLKALAVIGAKRLKAAPDVPTTKELGIDAEYYGWVGLLAPVKTPKPIIDKLRETLKKVTENKTFIDMVETPGDEVNSLGGEELAKYMNIESLKISKLYAEMIKEGAK